MRLSMAICITLAMATSAFAEGGWRKFAEDASNDDVGKAYIAGMAAGAVFMEAAVQSGNHEVITFCPPKGVNINDGIAIEALKNSPHPKNEVTVSSLTFAVILGLQKMFPCK